MAITPHANHGKTTPAMTITMAALAAMMLLHGVDVTAWHGVLMPAKVDAAIVLKVNQEITRNINLPDVQEVLLQEGGEIAPTTPEKFAAVNREEYARWQKVVKTAGVAPDT